MAEVTFERIIDSLADYGFSGEINPHGYGEPLTDTRLPTFITTIRRKLPAARIVLYTNGDLLTESHFERLMEAGVHRFIVTFHGTDTKLRLTPILTSLGALYPHGPTITIQDFSRTPDQLMNRGGLVSAPATKATACFYPANLYFDYLGRSILCCNDYRGEVILGDIATQSVRTMLENRRNRRIRSLIFAGLFPFPLCWKCIGTKPHP